MDASAGIVELVRAGGMGDLLMITAVLPGLKAQGFRTRIVCLRSNALILQDNPYLDELVTPDDFTADHFVPAMNAVEKADRVIPMDYPTVDPVIGDFPVHVTGHFCQLTGVPATSELYVPLTEEHVSWGQQYADAVLIHTTTRYSPYKNWLPDRWQALCEMLRLRGIRVCQVGGPWERRIEGIEKIDSPSVLHAIGAIKACRLFIGLDSLFNHVTQALDKPSLILWGSTHPRSFGYPGNRNLVNGVLWQSWMGREHPTMHCQPCFRTYVYEPPNPPKPPCPVIIPYAYPVLPPGDARPCRGARLYACQHRGRGLSARHGDVVFQLTGRRQGL